MIAVIAVSPVHGQAAVKALRSEVKADLDSVAVHQKRYFALHNRFASSIQELASLKDRLKSSVEIVTANAVGWAAVGTLPGRLQESCVIMVNIRAVERPRTTPTGKSPIREGVALCDGD